MAGNMPDSGKSVTAATTPAVYALLKLHAELGGKLQQNAKQAVSLRASMKHVEAVLKLLQPSFNVARIMPRRRYNPNPLYKRGTVFRAVLEVLRDAPEPMTGDQIVAAMFRAKGIANPSKAERERLYGAIHSSLKNHDGKTVVGDESRPRRWRLAVASS